MSENNTSESKSKIDIIPPLLTLALTLFAYIVRDNLILVLVIIELIAIIIVLVIIKPEKRLAKWGIPIGAAIVLFLLGVFLVGRLPTFEISFLGLPYENEDAYYLTNHLIGLNGDLSDYDDMTLIPPEVEIIPRYTGNKNLGNMVLKVTGPTESQTYPLWVSFDRSSKPVTVTIPIADIVRLSEIPKTQESLETNLMLHDSENEYPKSTLSFEVIQLSNPFRQFNDRKEMQVKNTPWVQTAKIARRGDLYLDYSLENLGAESTFHCYVTFAKAVKPIDYGHDFWGDAEIFHYGPDCEPFTLKTGETYKIAFPLNEETMDKNFTIGRYLVQVYTFSERNDVVFSNGKTFSTVSNSWLFANDGVVLTFIVCNEPGRTCEDLKDFPVEQGNIRVFAYSSSGETGNGYAALELDTNTTEDITSNEYKLSYSLDPNMEAGGWSGMAFVFPQEMGFSMYNAVRFNIQLDKSPHRLSFMMTSTLDGVDTNKRVIIGDGDYGTSISDEQTITIPFEAFAGIDWERITAINFIIDEFMVPDNNLREIKISDIEFIRE